MSNTVNLLIVFTLVILNALFWKQILGMLTEESLALSACAIMLIVFFCGLVGRANYAFIILGVFGLLGLVCFAFNLSLFEKKQGNILQRALSFFSPSLLAFGLLFLYTVVAFKGALFTYPDEIYQWGSSVKYMTETGKLPFGSDFTGAAITLSTATMFQYIWVGLVPFIERNCFVGNFMLAMIPIFLPFSGCGWRNWKKVFLYSGMIFLTINVFSYVKYYNLLQDIVLPFWVGGCIAWILWKQEKKLRWELLIPAIMCIGSMKSMVGPLFSCILVIVILVRQVIVYEPKSMKELAKARVLGLSVLILFSMCFLSLVWSAVIQQNVYDRFITYNPDDKDAVAIITSVLNYVFAVISGNVKAFPFVSFFILFIIVLASVYKLPRFFHNEKDRKLYTIVFSLYGIGFIGYLFVMLYAYFYVFETSDSEIAAGLDRYFAYYMLLCPIPLLSVLLMPEKFKGFRGLGTLKTIILVALIFGTGEGFIGKVSTINQKADGNYQKRLEIKQYVQCLNEMTQGEGKIFLLGTITANDSKILSFELGDRYIWNEDCYKMYNRSLADLKTYCDVETYPDLIDVLEYDYLWCYGVPEDNLEVLRYVYGLSDLEAGAVYRIDRTNGEIQFTYVDNLNEAVVELEEEQE